MRGSERAWLLATALVAAACGGDAAAPVENAVLVCLDTVRYDTLAVAQAGDDEEASRRWSAATRLTRVQSTAPWTLPAVASVFTSLYPNEHRAGAFLGDVANLKTGFPLPLTPTLPTLAGMLSSHGFETVGFVAHSWFRQRFGLQQGFATLDLELERADEVLARTEAWLDARAEREDASRFFLYLHFMEAHRPMHLGRKALAPQLERSRRMLAPEVERMAPALRDAALASDPGVCETPRALRCLRYLAYADAVASLRRSVAGVIGMLEARGLLDRTAVVVFSDHGEEFLDHAAESAARGLDPRGEYGYGHGHTLYQEQLHVPLAIWHPAVAPGEVSLPASLVDVAPTLLGWLGVPADPSLTGRDLGPLLAGEEVPDLQRPVFSSSVAFGPEREAVVRGDRKRIDDGGSGAGPLVFDLAEDPRERDPSDARADAELGALLSRYRALRKPGGTPAAPTAEELEELQALGYLEDADTAPR